MSNERIDFSELEDLQESWEERLTEEGIKEALGHWLFENGNELIAELKRCYEELDVLEELLRAGLLDEQIYNAVKASQ